MSMKLVRHTEDQMSLLIQVVDRYNRSTLESKVPKPTTPTFFGWILIEEELDMELYLGVVVSAFTSSYPPPWSHPGDLLRYGSLCR